MFSFALQIQSCFSKLWRLVFEFEMKVNQTNKQKISRANQNVLYSGIRSRACGGMVCLPLSKMTFVKFFLCICVRFSLSLSECVCKLYTCPLCLCVSDCELLYHLCELEKHLVSFPIFSAAKPVSERNIKLLHTHCGGRSSITSEKPVRIH